jgi:hypothetical protein
VLGDGPHEGTQCPSNSDDDLDRGGELFQPQLEVPTDRGRIPVGPGAFDQRTTGMGLPGLGDAPLLPPRPTRRFRGGEPQRMHELPGGLEACQVSSLRHRGYGDGALDAAPRLEGLDHRS